MKRINNYVLNGALALLSTAGFVACSSSDDVTDAPVNPTYDGKSVKTQFAINVATPSNGKTRMSDVNTQNDGNFLGMNSIKLFPVQLTGTETPSSSTQWTRNITLEEISNSGISSLSSKKIYSNVDIPVGTNNFLFYGFGPMGTGTASDMFKKGTLKTTFPDQASAALSTVSVELFSILGADNSTLTTMEGYYKNYLNTIKSVSGWSSTDDVNLLESYNKFIRIGSSGVRCGSASAILNTVEMLYNVAYKAKTNSGSTTVQTLAQNIMSAITPTEGDIIVKATAQTDGTYKLAYDQAESSPLEAKYTFPLNLNLPEGAAQLTYDDNNGFGYKDRPTIGTTGSALNVYGLMYPASIAYTANTKAKATTKKMKDDDWPNTVSDWDNSDKWPSEVTWTYAVESTSNSVALVNNINYSVACLKTKVKCKDAATTLSDNRKDIVNDGTTLDQSITIPTDGFKVTGVLVGGQPNKVDWQFIDYSSNRDAVIYDNDLTSINAKAGTYSTENYTLVFDNYHSGVASQDDVLMAIELENNSGSEFYGIYGVIMKDQKFYLVAKLTIGSSQNISSWPSADYRFPGNGTTRVFVQDYTTEVNLTINDLKRAYSTIPDLRSVELQLGLSVDLNWQTGLTFDVPLGGTTN